MDKEEDEGDKVKHANRKRWITLRESNKRKRNQERLKQQQTINAN